jgi:hypothetical protein
MKSAAFSNLSIPTLAFVKAVLSAIPLHQLLVNTLPKKTLKQLAKIERGFFWAGRAEANGGNLPRELAARLSPHRSRRPWGPRP